jgi:hypothetical protein
MPKRITCHCIETKAICSDYGRIQKEFVCDRAREDRKEELTVLNNVKD